jgi:hypothetical protein
MGNIENHLPGSFCWLELATTDQRAAQNFYEILFGWKTSTFPIGPSDVYSIFKLDGRDAAAAYTLRAEDRSKGVPPHWMVYVSVESADTAASRAAELGGKILAPAFDVMDFGRMSVLQDPTGAIFSVWQPKRHPGTKITGVNGTLCWADLNTPDAKRAGEFYAALFGWKLVTAEHDSSGYLHIHNGEEPIGGIPPAAYRNPNAPPHWMLYFAVDDVDAVAALAQQHGGRALMPPMRMEHVGRIAVLADPQGAAFAIFKSARS